MNPVIFGYLKVGAVFACGLFDNPRIGFDTPFLARVEIAIEPSDILDFVGLYFNDRAVGGKLQGMVQINAITPWKSPSMQAPLTPKRLNLWHEARARCNAEGFAKDPVGLVEFVGCRSEHDAGNSMTAELHIPDIALAIARRREPFVGVSAVTGALIKQPMSAAACLEFVNLHIRADKQNQLHLRTGMTEQDLEAIRAAGRGEDALPARILKEKMQREHLYADFVSNHKPTCHADERSSGLFKLVQMFSVNPVLMGYLKVGIVFECGLLDNPRIGFDTPFLARIEIAIEPSDVLNFGGLYVNDPTVEEKLQGMLQVNAITAWQSPSMRAPLTPKRLNTWREARARCNAEGFAEDPVGLIEFVGRRRTADSGNSMTAELHIPTMTLAVAMTRTPFTAVSAFTGIRTEKPLSAASCLEFINSHIRADKQNQLRLRTEMTEQDKEVIRAAGRDEDTFSTRILKEKMQREQLYAGCLQLTLSVSVFIPDDFSR
ncbi:hypothetical protein EDD22DRAFT_793353 [Suillus occidentalis]|nr:hypothetical protein EDD22DRAFT_793353 [Suillus occidentalis]